MQQGRRHQGRRRPIDARVMRGLQRMLQLADVFAVMQCTQSAEQVRQFGEEGVGIHGRSHRKSVCKLGRNRVGGRGVGHRRMRPMAGSVRLGRPVST